MLKFHLKNYVKEIPFEEAPTITSSVFATISSQNNNPENGFAMETDVVNSSNFSPAISSDSISPHHDLEDGRPLKKRKIEEKGDTSVSTSASTFSLTVSPSPSPSPSSASSSSSLPSSSSNPQTTNQHLTYEEKVTKKIKEIRGNLFSCQNIPQLMYVQVGQFFGF